jgi:GT2 family glycosyltransferase
MAYNAAKALHRQMEALLAQTRPLQEIIVVDNASTDGTGAMLAERYPQVTVLRMTENLGAAGAWAAGLSYAVFEKAYDWVWTFDHDSVPASNALEALLHGIHTLGEAEDEVGMAATLPVDRGTGSSYRPMLWRDGFVKGSSELLQQPVWMADLVIASGCMVRREMVEEIGLPRADFFMDIFDLEYCIRARSMGYKIAMITGAKLTHEIGKTRKINFMGYKRSWMNQPSWREYYISRNLAYLAWRLYPNLATKISIGRYLVVHFVQVLLFSSDKVASAMGLVRGLGDGLQGKLGILMRPLAGDLQTPGVVQPVAEKIEAGEG